IQTGLDTLTVPPLHSFEPGGEYWNRAELRVALNLNTTPPSVIVRNADGGLNNTLTSRLQSCGMAPGSNPAYPRPVSGLRDRAVHYSSSFRNVRENADIRMLEVDVAAVLNCLDQYETEFFDFGIGL